MADLLHRYQRKKGKSVKDAEATQRHTVRNTLLVVLGVLLAGALAWTLLPKQVELQGRLVTNGQPAVGDGAQAMRVRLFSLLDPSQLVYETTAEGQVRKGDFAVSFAPPKSVTGEPAIAVVCLKNDAGADGSPEVCQSGAGSDFSSVVCSPYYLESHILDIGSLLMGRNKVRAQPAHDGCSGDGKSSVGAALNLGGGFANGSPPSENNIVSADLSALKKQVAGLTLKVDGTKVKLGDKSSVDFTEVVHNLPAGLTTSVTEVTEITNNSTTVQTGVQVVSGSLPIRIGGTASKPTVSLKACGADETYVYNGSKWVCTVAASTLTIAGGTNISTSGNGTGTVTVSTVSDPEFDSVTTDTINPSSTLTVNGDVFAAGDLTFNGALLAGGQAGAAGQFLVSQGSGAPPIWQSYDFNAIADARIDLQKAAANGLATLDASGKVPLSQLPALAFGSTFVESTFNDCLATGAVKGDVCVDTGNDLNYILAGTDPTDSDDWVQLAAPGTPVQSVNGQIGNVSLTASNGLSVISSASFELGGTLTKTTAIN